MVVVVVLLLESLGWSVEAYLGSGFKHFVYVHPLGK